MKYRIGRKQKRVILDENGKEVLFLNKNYFFLAKFIIDCLNDIENTKPIKPLNTIERIPGFLDIFKLKRK